MKLFLYTLLFFSPFMLFAEVKQGPTIQVLLERNAKGDLTPFVINANGDKIILTLGTFVDALAESWVGDNVRPTPKEKLNSHAVAYIRLDKEEDGHLKAFIFDNKGWEEPLNLGNFLSVAAEAFPSCVNKDIDNQTIDIKLYFAQDTKGKLQAYLTNEKRLEEFNLGVLLKEVVALLNQCKVKQ